MTELKITKERVLEVANQSKEARELLETLFPDVFPSETSYKIKEPNDSRFSRNTAIIDEPNGNFLIAVYEYGLTLSPKYAWTIEDDLSTNWENGKISKTLKATLIDA